jgi:hypothetical protein
MMSRQTGFGVISVIAIILIGSLGAFLIFFRTPVVVEGDEETQAFDYDDVSQNPDVTDVVNDPDTEDLEEEDKLVVTPLDRDGDGITDDSDPDADGNGIPDEQEKPLPPPDYEFSGSVIAETQFLDSQGTPLAMIRQSFVARRGGTVIDSLKIEIEWNFKLGKDLDKESFEIYAQSKVNTFWEDVESTTNRGTLIGYADLFEFISNDPVSSTTYLFDMNDPRLGFIQIRDERGDLFHLYTTEDSFVINWEATITTGGGIEKIVKGSFSINLNFMYEVPKADPYYTPPQDYIDDYPFDPNLLESIVEVESN